MARANFSKYPVLLFLVLGVAATWPVTASAVVATTTGGGTVGYLPLNQTPGPQGGSPLTVRPTEPTGFPPLEYHGGPVMHSHEAFAIFWAASGYSFPLGYEEAIETYLEDVAADSGKSSNVYSVSAQYTDETGHATYDDSYGGSLVDTDAYGETCPEYSGIFGASYTACITDERMQEELSSVVEGEGLPHGLGVEYYIVLPPEVGSCFDEGSEFACFDEQFCAYHSFDEGPELVYANISYSPEDPIGCGVGQYPNGHSNGNADDTFSSLSHEANESITDPIPPTGYVDSEGLENGDECRNTPFEEDYGPPLGGSSGALFNEAINGDHYYLQQEWSNDIEDCAQRVGPPQLVVSGPASATVGQVVDFNSSSSTPGDGGIGFYRWELGDGSEEEGEETEEVAHSYSTPGTYTVTLTVFDDGGFAYSKSRQISIKAPEGTPSGGGSGGTATSSGSSSSSSSSGSGGPGPAPKVGIAIAAAKAKVKGGVVAIRLSCRGGPCSGVIKLLDHGAIGHAAFHLAAGAKAVVKVRLSARGLALLAKKPGSLDVALSGRGVRPRIVSLRS
jgi:PKD domain